MCVCLHACLCVPAFACVCVCPAGHNTYWSQLSNLYSLPTDCPQRDERLGWLADAHMSSRGASLMFSLAPFYTLFLRSIVADQNSL